MSKRATNSRLPRFKIASLALHGFLRAEACTCTRATLAIRYESKVAGLHGPVAARAAGRSDSGLRAISRTALQSRHAISRNWRIGGDALTQLEPSYARSSMTFVARRYFLDLQTSIVCIRKTRQMTAECSLSKGKRSGYLPRTQVSLLQRAGLPTFVFSLQLRTACQGKRCRSALAARCQNWEPMKRAHRIRIQKGVTLLVVGILASLAFMRFLRGQPELDGGDYLTSLMVGLLLSFSQLMIEGAVVPATRRLRLIPSVLIRATSYTVGAVVSVLLGISVANFVYAGVEGASTTGFFWAGWDGVRSEWRESLPAGMFLFASVYALAIVLVLVFIGNVAQKLGPGVLCNWLIGRYHEPREERCVFLFLDMRNSTLLAERLGDRRFSAMIRDVFFDITAALLKHDARVSHFIGDEVVLYWTIGKGARPGPEFARCFFEIQDHLARLAPEYLRRYGVVPEFKAGAHWGTVIATEVGQIKSEIVFHGDVLNVASRLERLCGEEGAELLVSGELGSVLTEEGTLSVEALGERQLKGKEQALQVASIRRLPSPAA